MSTPRATIPRTTPGRPRDLRKKVEEIIGMAGYAALMEADFYVIHGAMVRDLALILNEPIPKVPDAKQAPEATPEAAPSNAAIRNMDIPEAAT